MDANQIKDALNQEAQSIAELLLPNGKIERREWVCGSLAGEEGRSLKVCIDGRKIGTWRDFAADVGGNNLLELWKEVKQVSFIDAYMEAKKYLGVFEEEYVKGTATKKPKVVRKDNWDEFKTEKKEAWADYLIKERGISEAVVESYKVMNEGGSTILFPYWDEGLKEIDMVKFLAVARDNGKKKMWTSADTAKTLFGKWMASDDDSTLVITEGEIDAMSVSDATTGKYPAVSVPFGAKAESKDGSDPNMEWISNDFEFLNRFEKIILALDNDEAGIQATKSIVKRLGRDRCHVVSFGEGKDANEIHKSDGVNGTRKLLQVIEEAKPFEPENLKNASSYYDNMEDRFFNPNSKSIGIPLPWDMPFHIRMNELSILTGFSGSGKTMLLNYLCCHFASLDNRLCIASLEIRIEETISCLVAQAVASDKPSSKEDLKQAMEWLGDAFWFYDHVGQVDFDQMLDSFVYAHRRHGIKIFVIDSLMKCGLAFDDYQGQKVLVDRLADFVQKYDVHIFLVAHAKKKDSEKEYVGKMDVKGISEITDMANNVITVWRNKSKEEAINELEMGEQDPTGEQAQELDMTMFSSRFSVVKQRGDKGEEPTIKLWYNKDSRHYTEHWKPNSERFTNDENNN